MFPTHRRIKRAERQQVLGAGSEQSVGTQSIFLNAKSPWRINTILEMGASCLSIRCVFS